jgi:crotonobetainyl-CoA:carnitine CoA-transferase CaiB-like acyl-CoA transferase
VDFLRQLGLGGPGDHNNAPTFNQMNLGVKSIALDMTSEAGKAVARRLVPHCDIVIENMRGPVMAKWGLGYEDVRALRPDIIYVSSQGLGEGPYGGYQTYGPNLQAFSGVSSVCADDPFPVGSTLNHPDHVAGKQALAPLLAALIRRDRTGEGAYLDCAQFEAAATLITEKFLLQQLAPECAGPIGNGSFDMAPHGCYPCEGEDTWCAIAVADDGQWRALAALIGEAWAEDEGLAAVNTRLERRDMIDEKLGRWTARFPAESLASRLRATGIAASKVRIGDDLAADQPAHESGFFAFVSHPTAGTRAHTGLPVTVAGGRRIPVRRAPLLGEHDEYVLFEVLGLTPGEVGDLAAAGAIGY